MSEVSRAAGDKVDQKEEDRWAASLSPGRIEALTDGTFAIAMTILVLELSVPQMIGASAPGEHPTSLLEMWGEFYIYVLGFLALGVYWVLHSYMFHFIRRSDGVLMWLNIFFLVLAALVPFSTKVLEVNEVLFAGPESEWTTAGLFFTAMTIGTILLLLVMWQYATRGYRLVDTDLDKRTISALKRVILIGASIMSIGTILSYFFALAGWLGFIALAYMIVVTARGHHGRLERAAD
jgi:uncharacterized membrane protein